MAYGTEVVLGFPPSQYAEIKQALGIPLPLTEEEFEDYLEMGPYHPQAEVELAEALKKAHASSLLDMGFTFLRTDPDSGGYDTWGTPEGERNFAPFRPSLFWDPFNMGDPPESSTWGIALSGRYFPTFLDWQNPDGTLWPIRFEASMNQAINIARKHIEAVHPIFSKADIVVIERHY